LPYSAYTPADARPLQVHRGQARRVIIEHLVAGNSRRRAAAAAQIDHETLSRWLKRGEKGAPGGRWRSFLDAVQLAEAPTQAPILVPLTPPRPTRAEVDEAWRFLERSAEFERPETVKVEVVHSPVTAGARLARRSRFRRRRNFATVYRCQLPHPGGSHSGSQRYQASTRNSLGRYNPSIALRMLSARA
jgi:hypothetical protein